METERAKLALELMEKYDTATLSLKALGAHQRGEATLTPQDVEAHRWKATRWFNHLYALLGHNLIDLPLFLAVTSRSQATLWVERLADLDAAVRKRAGEQSDAPPNPVETFWRAYAEGRIQLPRRRWQHRVAEWLLR